MYSSTEVLGIFGCIKQNFRILGPCCTKCGGNGVIQFCLPLQIISSQVFFIPYDPLTTSQAKAIPESLFANSCHFPYS